jgi:hypothetical protein
MLTDDEARLCRTAARARWTLEELAAELPYASPDAREALWAALEFERWLLESCALARERPRPPI